MIDYFVKISDWLLQNQPQNCAVIIAGATASGKSAFALDLAEHIGKSDNMQAYIVNADSMQLYRDLRIVTACPNEGERQRYRHELYNILPAAQNASAGWWLQQIQQLCSHQLKQRRKMIPIIVGGTGMYIKVLLEGIANIPEVPHKIRDDAQKRYDQLGGAAMLEELSQYDPEIRARVNIADRQRIIRAYSVWSYSGQPLSYWQKQEYFRPLADWQILRAQIDLDRAQLYDNCNRRFKQMIDAGGVEEVANLIDEVRPPENAMVLRAVGVAEIAAYLRGEYGMDEMQERASQATRHYAKRQLTWLRGQYNADMIIPSIS